MPFATSCALNPQFLQQSHPHLLSTTPRLSICDHLVGWPLPGTSTGRRFEDLSPWTNVARISGSSMSGTSSRPGRHAENNGIYSKCRDIPRTTAISSHILYSQNKLSSANRFYLWSNSLSPCFSRSNSTTGAHCLELSIGPTLRWQTAQLRRPARQLSAEFAPFQRPPVFKAPRWSSWVSAEPEVPFSAHVWGNHLLTGPARSFFTSET